ncbi:DUF1566 domain-containing protein [Leucothrix mucor]|uniref:Lcl C-terminal domain-containing protein n=1 Tax=Leucothrix mucor TaxID=45248 RepID=UPI0003B3DE7A|nr:DUF1566 domain-containing protein [Leucothrix mucor]
MHKVIIWFVFVAGLSGQVALAATQGCNEHMARSTPLSRYDFLLDGKEVRDNVTGLIWKRCPEGRAWNGTVCTGIAAQYDWPAALALSDGTWRLPNIKELESISEVACFSPSINTVVFPGTPHSIGAFLWSSSPYIYHEQRMAAWFFHPDSGGISINDISSADFVRMVR